MITNLRHTQTIFQLGCNFRIISIGLRHFSSKGEGSSCCKKLDQTKGKKVVKWPADPPPPWFGGCGTTQPPNYDPYRIKTPEIAVPPLPPGNAKDLPTNFDARVLFNTATVDLPVKPPQALHNPHVVHPDNWKVDRFKKIVQNPTEKPKVKLGYHGTNKLKYAFHEPWKPLDRMTLLAKADSDEPMLDCTKIKPPCSVKQAPPPPPCPPPPPKPFPWIFVWPFALFFTLMGFLYKLYLWKEEHDRLSESKPIWRPRKKVKRPVNEQDLPACVQYLIVGTGAAGWAAYQSIMARHATAKVFFITKEDFLPYIRPPLSKHMWFNPDPPELMKLHYIKENQRHSMKLLECKKFMDPTKFYRLEKGPAVAIATGWCVLRVDPQEHIAYIKTGCGEQAMHYERCLLATGSRPNNLKIFSTAPKKLRDKVCTMRTIRDLEVGYRRVKEARHVTIIGGGFIGTELAWHIGRMNKEAYINDPENYKPLEIVQLIKNKGMLAGVLPEYLGEWALEKIRAEDVKIMQQVQVYDAFLTPDERVQLTLSNGQSIVTDYIFVAIGGSARTEMAYDSDLETDPINGGFIVNSELEARKHLFVAGDAASLWTEWKHTRIRFEHYMNAVETGTIAGANMTGQWIPCQMEPHYWFQLGDVIALEVIGEVGACMPTVGIFKLCDDEDDEEPKATVQRTANPGEKPCPKMSSEYRNRYKRGMLFYLRDELVVGVAFWNMPPIEDRTAVVSEMLRARPTYEDINLLAELCGFPETKCVYKQPAELVKIGPCLNELYKKWE